VNHSSLTSSGKDASGSGGNILYSFLKQLRPGMDLVSLSCPSFVLSPFSYLEARTDYIAPLPCLLNINHEPDPVNRFLRVCQWVISSLTFIPSYGVAGVKPYNPILGERYSCIYTFDSNARGGGSGDRNKYTDSTYAYAEQVSHHPPISSQYMCNDEHQFVYTSTSQFQVKFRGTFVETQIIPEGPYGVPTLELTGIGEKYVITYPNIVVTGLYWGTTQVSHDGKCSIVCDRTGMELRLNCSSKKHAVEGEILSSGKKLFTVSGGLDGTIDFKNCSTKKTGVLVDSKNIEFPKKLVRPLSQQDEMESRKVWDRVTQAIVRQDFEAASREKNSLEEEQRLKRSKIDVSKYEPAWWSKQLIQQDANTMVPNYVFKGQRVVNEQNVGQEYHCVQKKDSFTNYVRKHSFELVRNNQAEQQQGHHVTHGFTQPLLHNHSVHQK